MVNRRNRDLRTFIASLVALIVLNIISSFYFFRADLTSDKRFTLSDVTRGILSGLDGDMQITVYLDGELPAGFQRLQRATSDMLIDMKAYSAGRMAINFVDPLDGSTSEQDTAYRQLIEKGLEPTNLSVRTERGLTQRIIFPAALISYKGTQVPVRLLQTRAGASPDEVLNNSIQNLEYAFVSAIRRVSGGNRGRIGFSEGHGELSDLQIADAINALGDAYEVGRVDLNEISFEGLDALDLLIIAKPQDEFPEAAKFKIDYFVMKGGSLIWSIDQVSAELDSLRGAGEQLTFPKKLNLDDMLFKYGARLNYDLLADMNSAQIPLSVGSMGGSPQIQMVPWLFYPIFVPVSKHALVKNLDGIRSEFAGSIDTIRVPGVKNHVILTSSPFNQKVDAPSLLTLGMIEQQPDPNTFRSEPKITGLILEGRFPSVFSNRPVPAGISLPAGYARPDSSVSAKMMIISDGDIFKNQINESDGSHYPLGFDRYTRQQFANRNFLLNAVDYLTDDVGIIELRNREVQLRLLDRAKVQSDRMFWQTINIGVPLLMLIVCGIFQHYYRRRKYAR